MRSIDYFLQLRQKHSFVIFVGAWSKVLEARWAVDQKELLSTSTVLEIESHSHNAI